MYLLPSSLATSSESCLLVRPLAVICPISGRSIVPPLSTRMVSAEARHLKDSNFEGILRGDPIVVPHEAGQDTDLLETGRWRCR